MAGNVKRYLMEFGGSMAAYTAAVPVSIWLLRGHEHSALRYVFALLPVVPSGFAMWAVIRAFRGFDELQRRIHLEAITFSFLATCLLTLTWGFLQNAGLPQADVIWVAPLLIALWGFGLGISSKRYQ